MRTAVVTAMLTLAMVCPAQRIKTEIDAQTPEGLLLQQAAQEEDEAKKLALYGEFLAKHPKHEMAPYAWLQAQPLYLKAANHAKVLEAAEAVLAADPLNAPAAYNALQSMEQQKDNEGIKTWSARTVEAARKMIATKQPEDEEEAELWKQEVDYARQVITRAEYALYAGALQTGEAAVTIDLASTLEQRHPESQYNAQIAGRYALALYQAGRKEDAARVAEKHLAADPKNEDLAFYAADWHFQKKEWGQAVQFGQMMVAALSDKPAPAGADPAAWEKRKTALLGMGWWFQGMSHGASSRWAEADKAFRAALPFIAGNNELLAPAYFYLGLSNYTLGKKKGDKTRLADGRKFTEACVKIKSPYQAQASRNLQAILQGQ
jgi:tetratricopeptide (TPR) repeat protein